MGLGFRIYTISDICGFGVQDFDVVRGQSFPKLLNPSPHSESENHGPQILTEPVRREISLQAFQDEFPNEAAGRRPHLLGSCYGIQVQLPH